MGVCSWLRNEHSLGTADSLGLYEMMVVKVGHNLRAREDLDVQLLLDMMDLLCER